MSLMARRPCLFAPGLLYHIIVRGNQRQPTFLTEHDYHAYLERVATYRERYGVRLYAYCLMPNHMHLLLRIGGSRLQLGASEDRSLGATAALPGFDARRAYNEGSFPGG